MDIASLCILQYLIPRPRFPPHRQIRRHRWTKTVPRLVLLDANALLMPFQFRVNLDREIQRLLGDADFAVPKPVLTELEFLAERDREARAGLRLARRYRVIDATGSADDALLDLAGTNRAVVVTNDQPLLERLREQGVPRLFLRSRNHLVGVGLLPCEKAYPVDVTLYRPWSPTMSRRSTRSPAWAG